MLYCSALSSLRCLEPQFGQLPLELCAAKSVFCQQAELDLSIGSFPCRGRLRTLTPSLPLHSFGHGRSGGQPRDQEIDSTSGWRSHNLITEGADRGKRRIVTF